MGDTAKQIIELLTDNQKSAAEMCHATKVLGNGRMQDGFTRIGKYFQEEMVYAASKGRMQGGIIGLALGAATVGLAWCAVSRHKKKVDHENEGQAILSTIEESNISPDSDIDEFSNTEGPVVTEIQI